MSTTRVTVQEAQEHLERLLARVEQGERVIITRPGRPAIHLKEEAESRTGRLPSLGDWRASIRVKGEGLSQVVREQRSEERY